MRFVVLLLFLTSSPLWASSQWREVSVESSTGDPLSITEYGESDRRILWIPSEFSTHSEDERLLLEAIAAIGYQVHWLDLHQSFFLTNGRNSYDDLPLNELKHLIQRSIPSGGRLTLMATGRGAKIALMLARQWQLESPRSRQVVDMILLHPNLSSGVARAGERLSLDPIAYNSNLPIYVLQPSESAKRWYLKELREALSQGGSDVFIRLIQNVTDGFQVRDDATAYEREVRKQIPAMVDKARDLLSLFGDKKRLAVSNLVENRVAKSKGLEGELQPIKGNPKAPPLKLRDVEGRLHDLSSYKGRKLLINFWATWCPPCVEEIPSLGRLQQKFNHDRLLVLSVDIGETEQRVKSFLKKVPAAFPVMLDPNGDTVKPWRIRAFPTTFLIDAQGRLRYGYFGALQWDDPKVVDLIKAVR